MRDIEGDIKRQVAKIARRSNRGELVGPDLECAILDLFARTWVKLDISGRTLQEAISDRNVRPAEYEVTP